MKISDDRLKHSVEVARKMRNLAENEQEKYPINHGFPQTEYDSPMLRLLNCADMTTGPKGESLTIQERIDDIGVRYGEDSVQYKDAIKLADMLK